MQLNIIYSQHAPCTKYKVATGNSWQSLMWKSPLRHNGNKMDLDQLLWFTAFNLPAQVYSITTWGLGQDPLLRYNVPQVLQLPIANCLWKGFQLFKLELALSRNPSSIFIFLLELSNGRWRWKWVTTVNCFAHKMFCLWCRSRLWDI